MLLAYSLGACLEEVKSDIPTCKNSREMTRMFYPVHVHQGATVDKWVSPRTVMHVYVCVNICLCLYF